MMMEVGKIAAICLIGAVLTLLLQKQHPEIAALLALAVCIGVVLFLLGRMEAVLSLLQDMAQIGGLSNSILEPLLKTVAIALISRTGAELCKDANQNAIGTVIETAGAFCAVAVSIPLFGAVWELLRGML